MPSHRNIRNIPRRSEAHAPSCLLISAMCECHCCLSFTSVFCLELDISQHGISFSLSKKTSFQRRCLNSWLCEKISRGLFFHEDEKEFAPTRTFSKSCPLWFSPDRRVPRYSLRRCTGRRKENVKEVLVLGLLAFRAKTREIKRDRLWRWRAPFYEIFEV